MGLLHPRLPATPTIGLHPTPLVGQLPSIIMVMVIQPTPLTTPLTTPRTTPVLAVSTNWSCIHSAMMGVNTLLPLLTTLPLMTTLEKIVIGQKIIAFTGMNMIGVPAFSILLTQLRTPLTERHTVPKMASIASAQ